MIDRDKVKACIQEILNKEHKIPQKKVIKETPDGLAFADPITGDSKKNVHMKRCHLYWDSFYIVSYDDEGYRKPFTKFCSDFNINLDTEQRLAIYEHIDNNVTYNDADDLLDNSFDNLISLEEVIKAYDSPESNSQISALKPIQTGSKAHIYLKARGIFNYVNIYEATFYKAADWKEPVLVILNRKGDKILGLQVRNLQSGYKRMFKIYNYEHLLESIGVDTESIDINELVIYNKLSYYYNILNVNFNTRITIFEGYLDSMFYPNSIGVVGVSTDMRLLENNDLDIQYFYDNDKAGWVKSSEKLKKSIPVFLWGKLFDNIIESQKSNDPYSVMHRIKKVKDLNSLAVIVKNPYKSLKLNDFFSEDVYDNKYIPIVKIYKKWINKKGA
jgi:hypothetical protein